MLIFVVLCWILILCICLCAFVLCTLVGAFGLKAINKESESESESEYCYAVRNLYSNSDIWEGLLIDVTRHNLHKRLTIGHIYRHPHDNSNKNTKTFINDMSPIIDNIKKNSYAAILRGFNINLLQIHEREKYENFFDMMCTNNVYPQILFPTRIATWSHSLLDQIFCQVSCKRKDDICAFILLSGISDHFPCAVNFKILNKRLSLSIIGGISLGFDVFVPPKYVYRRTVTESSLDQYHTDLLSLKIFIHTSRLISWRILMNRIKYLKFWYKRHISGIFPPNA